MVNTRSMRRVSWIKCMVPLEEVLHLLGDPGWPPSFGPRRRVKVPVGSCISTPPRKPSYLVERLIDLETRCPWRGVIFQPATFRIRLGLLQVRLWTHLGWDWQENLWAFQGRCVILAAFSYIFYDQIVERLSSHNTDNTSCRSDGLVPENTIYCPAQWKVFLTDLSASFFRFFQPQHPRRMNTASRKMPFTRHVIGNLPSNTPSVVFGSVCGAC